MFLSGVTRLNRSWPMPCTTLNGYPAGPVFVHDDDAGGAELGGLLVLVGPAAVVRHRLAAEDLVVQVARRVALVTGGSLTSTMIVLPLTSMPRKSSHLILRRLHAVAGEHELGVFDLRVVRDVLAEGDDLVIDLELFASRRPSSRRAGPAAAA